METTLAAEARNSAGKGFARKARAAGKLPAVLYGNGAEATMITVDPVRLVEIFRKTRNRNTVVELEIDGAKVPAIVKEAQRHPVGRQLLHVDFYRVTSDKPVEVMVPLKSVGRHAGAALGGRLRLIRRSVRARCIYDKIPEVLEIDVTPMDIGDMRKVSEITVPEGVEVVYDDDFNVISCYGKKQQKE